MREKLLEMLPEILLISDPDLRERTIRVWEGALAKGDWSPEDLHQMPFTLLIEKTPISLIEHTRAVTQCALKIADILKDMYGDKVEIDKRILLAGALLHDVGKLFEIEREGKRFVKSREGKLVRHPISGAAIASQYELPPEVIHIIAFHSKEGDAVKRTIEATIINHADFVNFEVFKD